MIKSGSISLQNSQQDFVSKKNKINDMVDTSNLGQYFFTIGDYEWALKANKVALSMKEYMYGMRTINSCISLSGIADAYLKLKDFDKAMETAKSMEAIAKEINSIEQLKISREIIVDINNCIGVTNLKRTRDQKEEMKGHNGKFLRSSELNCIDIEYPSKACSNFLCETNSNDLKSCAKCKRVKYCTKECQKTHWKHHKPNCKLIMIQMKS